MRLTWRLLILGLVVTAAPAANIRRIDLEGFQAIPVATVRRDLPLQPGQPYDAAEVEQARNWLLGLGVFISAVAETKEQGQVVDVLLRVVENPLVRAVRIEGNTQIAAAALRPTLLTQPRQILSRRNLALDANTIGKAYLDNGLRIMVETAYDPAPERPDVPVTVIFKVTEITIGRVRVEPLAYLRQEVLTPLLILQPGELLTEKRLVEQAGRLRQSGLFQAVEDPSSSDPDEQGAVTVLFRVAERDMPLLTRELLPQVDLARLAHWVRFSAVEVPIERSDFELWASPADLAARLAAARQRATQNPTDAAAAYALFDLTRRAGGETEAAAKAARPVLEAALQAAPSGRLQLQLGLVLDWLGERAKAAELLSQAARDQAVGLEAYEPLLNLRVALLRNGEGALDALRQTVLDGLAAIVDLPANPSLATIVNAAQFHYTAVTISMLGLELNLEPQLRLDAAASRRLLGTVYEHARLRPDAEDAVLRQLGRLVTALGFAYQVAGPKVAPKAAWDDFVALLKASRDALLTQSIDTTDDPAAWYFLALNDVLRDDLPAARATVLGGLLRQPANERLVDVYILTCMQGRFQDVPLEKSLDLLRASIADVQAKIAGEELRGWGPLMLLAKLQLALRDTLPQEATAEREQARQAAEAAARNAVASNADIAGGWWILGLAQMKGPQPAQALESYRRVDGLNPRYREIRYALALAKMVAGNQEGGLRDMAALRGAP